MRILVAGATGVLGSRVVARLLDADHDVYGTSRSARRAEGLGGGAVGLVMDALDPQSVERAVDEAQPDAIIHELTDLARADFGTNARLRVAGTRNLVDVARHRAIARMVAQSISWAYRPSPSPASEDEPFATGPATGESLFPSIEALEDAVRSLSDGVVLRYGLLYGPGTWYSPDGDQVEALRAGRFVATTAWTSFVHVDDAADATVAALGWPPGAYNVVDDEPAHVSAWGPLLAAAVGRPGLEVESRAEGRAASNLRARGLGWSPRHATWRSSLLGQLTERRTTP